eukprot:1157342-Pelagomonas_calceolata.AAC.10
MSKHLSTSLDTAIHANHERALHYLVIWPQRHQLVEELRKPIANAIGIWQARPHTLTSPHSGLRRAWQQESYLQEREASRLTAIQAACCGDTSLDMHARHELGSLPETLAMEQGCCASMQSEGICVLRADVVQICKEQGQGRPAPLPAANQNPSKMLPFGTSAHAPELALTLITKEGFSFLAARTTGCGPIKRSQPCPAVQSPEAQRWIAAHISSWSMNNALHSNNGDPQHIMTKYHGCPAEHAVPL